MKKSACAVCRLRSFPIAEGSVASIVDVEALLPAAMEMQQLDDYSPAKARPSSLQFPAMFAGDVGIL